MSMIHNINVSIVLVQHFCASPLTKFILHYSQMVCVLRLFELQPFYNLGTRSISVYCWGWGVSLMLGGYAKGKSPSFKSPEAEYG